MDQRKQEKVEVDEREAFETLGDYLFQTLPTPDSRRNLAVKLDAKNLQQLETLFLNWLGTRIDRFHHDLLEMTNHLQKLVNEPKFRARIDRTTSPSQLVTVQVGEVIANAKSGGDESFAMLFFAWIIFAMLRESGQLRKKMAFYTPVLEKLRELVKKPELEPAQEQSRPTTVDEFFERIWSRQKKRGVIS